jgi:hypothetical protein
MEFKEKPAELKLACPLCGRAISLVGQTENSDPVCQCGLDDYNQINADNVSLVTDLHPAKPSAQSEDVDDSPVGDLVDDDDEGQIRDFTGSTLIKDDFQVLSLLGQGCVTVLCETRP